MPNDAVNDKSMAPLQNRSNDRKAFCTLYLSIMAASSIAVAVQAMDEVQDSLTAVVHDVLLGTLYAVSAALLFGFIIYFSLTKSQSFEAVNSANVTSPFTVKYSGCGERVNLYLRLGLAMFAAMSIGQSSTRMSQISSNLSLTWPQMYKSIFEIFFYISQTCFILIFHRIVILHNSEIFGACLIHVLSTNLCMWADVTVEKIRSTLHLHPTQVKKNTLGNETHPHEHPEISSEKLSFYLLPAVSEFCLLSATLIYEITNRIGEPNFIELEDDHEKTESRKNVFRTWLINVRSGYWAPILIVFCVIICAIVTGVTPKVGDVSVWKCIVLFIEEMVLNSLGIFVTLIAFLKVRKLKFTIASSQSQIDEFLLYIAFFFTANYLVATISLTSYMKLSFHDNQSYRYLLMGRLALDVLELIQIILQTYLIQDCLRRCSEEELQQKIKPGRQVIAILLGINLAGWVVKSFQLKKADILYSLTSYEIPYGWILVAITMPVYLFYRYHCTVCLSQSFTMLYEDETHRFEALWRQNPIYLSNLFSQTNFRALGNGCTMQNPNDAYDNNDDWQRKLSTQSFNYDYNFPRRSSFFNPQPIMPNLSSLYDLENQPNSVPENVHTQPRSNSLAFAVLPYSQKKSSAANLKKFSFANIHPNKVTAPSKVKFQESESFEGPNYFLSSERHHNDPSHTVGSTESVERATQTVHYTYEQNRLDRTDGSKMFANHPLQRHQRMKTLLDSKGMTRGSYVAPMMNAGFSGDTGNEHMKRRQTLINLETARNRFLVAEMEHKRVLDRSQSIGLDKKIKKKSSNRNSRKPAKSNRITLPSELNENNETIQSTSSSKAPPVPQTRPTMETNYSPTILSKGIQPPKLLPLMIATNLVQPAGRKDSLLSSVPEESQNEAKQNDFPTNGSDVSGPNSDTNMETNHNVTDRNNDSRRLDSLFEDEEIRNIIF